MLALGDRCWRGSVRSWERSERSAHAPGTLHDVGVARAAGPTVNSDAGDLAEDRTETSVTGLLTTCLDAQRRAAVESVSLSNTGRGRRLDFGATPPSC